MLVTLLPVLALQGCFVAPLRIAEPLDVTVVDAESGAPIPGATTIYFVCDIHAFDYSGTLVRRASNERGQVKIKGRRKWGVWFPAPGGLPVPNHFIAIWAPGYSAFVFAQYDDTVETLRDRIQRQDVRDALDSIPMDRSSSDPALNPTKELIGGTIRLRRSAT